MKIRLQRAAYLALGLLTIVLVSLNSGCKPLEAGEVETFAGDLLLSVLAAFLF